MKEFNTSLLREKFIIHDPNADNDGKPVVALSNRIVAELRDKNNVVVETFTVRAHNMHGCVRLAARIVQSFQQAGPILTRANGFDWEAAWETVVNDYERMYNPARWVAIYSKGRLLYENGPRHPLLDIIEKCNARNKGAYDDAIPMAEDAFKQTGRVVKIEYDGNVALVVSLEKLQGRCGIILRGADRTTTFNFSATAKKEGTTLNIPQILGTAAAFLEGIQLAFMVGMNTEKIRIGLIERQSTGEKQTKEARRRLGRLSAEIANLESVFEVRYRPERPEFNEIVTDAERLAQKILQPPEGGDFIA